MLVLYYMVHNNTNTVVKTASFPYEIMKSLTIDTIDTQGLLLCKICSTDWVWEDIHYQFSVSHSIAR